MREQGTEELWAKNQEKEVTQRAHFEMFLKGQGTILEEMADKIRG